MELMLTTLQIEHEEIDGEERIWFPFLMYRIKETGELSKYPPKNKEVIYTYVVKDATAFQAVCASGLLLDPRHTGRKPVPIVDNRNTTQ